MRIRPRGHFVLVEVIPVEEKTAGGIVLPSELVEREHGGRDIGKLVDIGPLAYKGFAHAEGPEDWGVKVGDLVEFNRYDGKQPRLAEDNEELKNLRIVNDNDIIAVMEEDDE